MRIDIERAVEGASDRYLNLVGLVIQGPSSIDSNTRLVKSAYQRWIELVELLDELVKLREELRAGLNTSKSNINPNVLTKLTLLLADFEKITQDMMAKDNAILSANSSPRLRGQMFKASNSKSRLDAVTQNIATLRQKNSHVDDMMKYQAYIRQIDLLIEAVENKLGD